MEILPKRLMYTGLIFTALDLLACVPHRPTEAPRQPTAIASETSTSTTSTTNTIAIPNRRLGILLENLDLSAFEGFVLGKNYNVSYPKVDIINATARYEVTVNLNGLDHWAQYCRLLSNSNPITFGFQDRLSSGSPGSHETHFGGNGVESEVYFGVDEFYRFWDREIYNVYGILPDNRTVNNAVNLSLNIRIIDDLCASARLSLLPQPLPLAEAGKILEEATQEANGFEESLLTGSRPLITAIHRISG